jgi:hypothetical protein
MTDNDNARNQCAAQAQHIAALAAAYNIDWDRYDELTGEDPDDLPPDDAAELQDLQAILDAVGDNITCADNVLALIHGDPLELRLYADWVPGETPDPTEFTILLCTGGPAVRLRGELNNYREPRRVWLEYQDWGTPWTEYRGDVDHTSLLLYARQFYFGE